MPRNLIDEGIVLDADAACAELCKRHLWYFVKQFWDEIVPNELVWNWHMKVLCDEIQISDERVFKRLPKLHDLIINVPPGTSKTKIVSVLSTAWEFARMSSIKVYVGSFSDAAIMGIADEVRLLMKSAKYITYFPDTVIRKDKDSSHNFKTTTNGEFYAFTVGGTLTSKHADILKVDDPLNPKQAASEVELKNANDFFDKTLPTRKVDKKVTPTYLIMQRLHVKDPTGHLLEKKGSKIRHVCLPGTVSKNVKPEEYKALYSPAGFLDENRLGFDELQELKIDLGSDGYAGQIDQTPSPEGGRIWKKWFLEIPDAEFPDYRKGINHGTDWDTAYTKEEENAASAFFTSFKFRNKIWIDDFGWDWLEFPELVKWIKTKPGPHYIEKKASGKSAKQALTRYGIPAIEVPVPADKQARAKTAAPFAEGGLVCIRKSLADKLYNDSRQGILFFPRGQYADVADCLAQMIIRQSAGGVKVMSETQERDILDELDYETEYD